MFKAEIMRGVVKELGENLIFSKDFEEFKINNFVGDVYISDDQELIFTNNEDRILYKLTFDEKYFDDIFWSKMITEEINKEILEELGMLTKKWKI